MSNTAVVILNWNGKKFLEQFLPALVEHTAAPDVSLIVADNGSSDGSEDFVRQNYPHIRWMGLDKNYGFTGGYNRALQQVEATYYVLLNSDVEVTKNWLSPLTALLDNNPEIAVCTPKIKSFAHRHRFEYAGAAGGFIDKYGFPFCRGRILNHTEEDHGQYDTVRPVFWASGACLVVRSELYHRLNGLDDDFFAHMEEIDFCWRVQQLGYAVVCCPQSEVFHVGGGTLSQEAPFKLYLNYRNSLYMLYKNLPDASRSSILLRRFCIDAISSVIYCLQGKFASFAALWKGYFHFWKHKKAMRQKRLPEHNRKVSGVYARSIVMGAFLSKKKRLFSAVEDAVS
jgi:GT2 family glycosyltransferase